MTRHKLQIVNIARRQGGQAQGAIGEIDPLVTPQLLATETGSRDAPMQTGRLDAFQHAPDFAVIQPDGLASLDVVEHLGKSASDLCWRQYPPSRVTRAGPPRMQIAR